MYGELPFDATHLRSLDQSQHFPFADFRVARTCFRTPQRLPGYARQIA